MADTVRELIIQDIEAELEKITIGNGYNTSIGSTVERGRMTWTVEELPAISLLPGEEYIEELDSGAVHVMPIIVVGVKTFDPKPISGDNVSVEVEKMLGDIIINLLGNRFTLTFNTGSSEISVGDPITGKMSTATGIVESITVSSGTWAGGDAAGTLVIRDKRGDFEAETIQVSGVDSAIITGAGVFVTRFNNRIDSIKYTGGGITQYPEDGNSVNCMANFVVRYPTVSDNPYLTDFV